MEVIAKHLRSVWKSDLVMLMLCGGDHGWGSCPLLLLFSCKRQAMKPGLLRGKIVSLEIDKLK